MNSNYYYAVSALFNGLFGAFVVYYVYLRNKQSAINRSFVYFGLAVSGWSLIYSLWAFADNAELAEFYVRRHMMFEALIPATFFHFAANFTNYSQKYKKVIVLSYIAGFFYSVGMLTPLMIAGTKKSINFEFWPVPGPLLPSHVFYFAGLISWGIGLLFYRFMNTEGKERSQAFWILMAYLIGFGGGSINWFLWFDIPVPPTTNFFVGIMFAMTAYAIVRHGLMDVDAMVEILRTSRTATLGLLASSLNHELRNPLYVAKGKIDSHLDAVERRAYTAEKEIAKSREALETASSQLTRAIDIVQRFSGFARPYKIDEPKQSIAAAEVISDVLGFASHEFALQQVQVEQNIPNDLHLHINRRQLEEIFFNLVMNACQAMQNGGRLSIHAAQAGQKITIEVSDTGCGISDEQRKHLFEPFFSTKGKEGTGLGLYITKQLVERNGGRIFAKSKTGKGTVFILEFKQ